jgi:hypothetical protein
MTVVESTEKRLVLKGSAVFSAFLILLGAALTGGGWLAWNAYLKQGERVRIKVLALPVFGVLAFVAGVFQLFTRMTVDGEKGTVTNGGLLGKSIKTRDAFSKVQLTVLPRSIEQHETLRLELYTHNDKTPDTLGSSRTNDTKAFYLANGAYELARLLDVPLVVEGETTEAPEKLRSILVTIETPPTITQRRAA